MVDSMMDQRYKIQIGKKVQFWGKKLYFLKMAFSNHDQNPWWVQTHDLRFTSLILNPLSYVETQMNRLIQTVEQNILIVIL